MNKSLKDVASSILRGEQLDEAVSNSETLKPGSKFKEGMKDFKDNASNVPVNKGEDLGTGAVKVGDDNPDATVPVSKDKSKSAGNAGSESLGVNKGNTPGEKKKASTDHRPPNNDGEKFGLGKEKLKQVNEEEIDEDEDMDLTEEEQAIIDEMIEAGLTEEEIISEMNNLYEEAFSEEKDDEDDDEEKDDDDDDEEKDDDDDKKDDEDDKKDDEDVNEEVEIDVSEDVAAMFSGEELSEEFKTKATSIFETAIRAKLNEYQTKLDEEFAEAIIESIDEIKESLTENVDNYLNYVVEQWMNDNEVAVESSLRSELTEDFISGLRNLFAENYIDIPEDKVDLVEELSSRLEDLESRLNEEIETNVQLTKHLNESTKFEVFVDEADGLTDTQIEKLKSLVENVDFEDEEAFRTKVKTLKESYFPSDVKKTRVLNEANEDDVVDEELQGPMKQYVHTLGRSISK